MKKSGILAASLAAASATAVSVSSSNHQAERDRSASSSSSEKFAPRFDGLRFIETLVTAHR